MIEVLEPGGLTLVQDLGRPGLAAMGVPPSGAADRGALVAANRLLGNPPGAACLEVTLGGLAVRARRDVLVALTGAPAPATLDGAAVPRGRVLPLPRGAVLSLGVPTWGLRTYLSVRGGIVVPAVLGSRSSDVLSGLGPPPVRTGHLLPVGDPSSALPTVDAGAVPASSGPVLMLDALPGPRADWFTPAALDVLYGTAYTVTDRADRVGTRLRGEPLERARSGELPSEGVVAGSVQVPADGQPLIFGPDHPVTGGYPVVAVLTDRARDAAAQLRPGQQIRFRRGGHRVQDVTRDERQERR